MLAGIAAKEALEDKKALQEAIETGMVQQKGLGKKKSRQKEAQRRVSQDGLNEVNVVSHALNMDLHEG